MSIKFLLLLVLFSCILSSIVLAEDYKIEIIDYPTEIINEIGWMRYFNIVVSNRGNLSLNNISISFDGEFPKWFEIENNNVSILQPNKNVSFLVKMNTPSTAETKLYPFTLNAKSKETRDSKSFSVRLFKTKTDTMMYQIQIFEIEIEEIRKNATNAENLGKDITTVLKTLNSSKDYLETAKNYIRTENYKEATMLLINAENMIKEAIFDLSIASPKRVETTDNQTSYEWVFIPPIVIAVSVIIVIIYMLKRKKKENVVKTPVTKIKEIVMEGRDTKNLESELNEIVNSKNLLEEEFKENLISKESYDELKIKYERRELELRAEIERNRKIA